MDNATWWSKATPLQKYGLIGAGFVAVSVAVLMWHKAHGGKFHTSASGHAVNTAKGIHRAFFGGGK